MEHSTAIMEEAGRAIDGVPSSSAPDSNLGGDAEGKSPGGDHRQNNYDRRKRKADFADASMHYGCRGGRDGGRGDKKRRKKRDVGRGEYFASQSDKRQRTEASREKRVERNWQKYGTEFSKEEIDAEERRPKRKVAVLIGYSGTGYKGMQISPSEKTIEGDIFNAFIAAGAISKANADDPKKASLVRCARTDKGVHAAGNMISLKLIVEDADVVQKINDHLSSQIRVWGIERTIGSFSCYQACDSRWYEYLIPSHAFLPPHPSSWLAKQLERFADEAGDREEYERRQEEVKSFWERVDEDDIKPLLESLEEDIRLDVIKALQGEDESSAKGAEADADVEQAVKAGSSLNRGGQDPVDVESERTEEAAIIINEPAFTEPEPIERGIAGPDSNSKKSDGGEVPSKMVDSEIVLPPQAGLEAQAFTTESTDTRPNAAQVPPEEFERLQRLRWAAKGLRNAYTAAKRQYRISPQRIERIQYALNKFMGTANYHNYTVQKTFKDPSAKRHIKSFVVNSKPILIGEGTDAEKSEWLSLKVHGQSFMMHQIRKMIGMVTLLVRCGSNPNTLDDSLREHKYSIPKVPGLGLLLERPVFDSYNSIQAVKHGREKLDFSKFDTKMEEFKQREIYQRIFREEEERNEFGKFFNHVDNFKEPYFLFVTSKGLEATKGAGRSREEGEDG